MTAAHKRVVLTVLVIHLILLKLTWLDLRRRPDAAVRGRKRMWRFASGVNTSGSVAYWLFGRRPMPAVQPD